MANVLKMDKQILIRQLLNLGWSYRRIHRETGIHRDTIARYGPNHPAKTPTESEQSIQNRPKHAVSLAEGCPPSTVPCKQKKPTRTSEAQAHDAVIREKVKQELSAQRIYQDLVVEYAYPHSYDSVKRYVRKLKAKTPKLFARIHTAAGEEAQVDFGKGAPTEKNGHYHRPWLFKLVLSYSRHSYEEVVWHQDVESFIRCHERAFHALGGVPKLIRLDNLKAGVLRLIFMNLNSIRSMLPLPNKPAFLLYHACPENRNTPAQPSSCAITHFPRNFVVLENKAVCGKTSSLTVR